MTENQGDNKGFFTKDDFIYILLMLPNQHWTIDQTEQTLCVFVEERVARDRTWEIQT
jgi:hypothetical protein